MASDHETAMVLASDLLDLCGLSNDDDTCELLVGILEKIGETPAA